MRRNGMRHRAVCAVFLASSVLVADAHAGVFRLRRTVVVGDSLLAGFGSGGLVGVGRPGQVDSAPAFVARRAHVRLPLPFMNPFYTSRVRADAHLYTCDRLGADGRCTAYEERPLVCRGYPWYDEPPREMPLPDPECGYAVDLPGRSA